MDIRTGKAKMIKKGWETYDLEGTTLDQITQFKYLGCDITYGYNQDIDKKEARKPLWYNKKNSCQTM